MMHLVLSVLASVFVAIDVSWSIAPGQSDDFEDGTTMGWSEGIFSPNPPTNVPSGGPDGPGDAYLQNISSGGFKAGSRMVMFNRAQWSGDFLSAGVGSIDVEMANFGATSLHVRIAITGALTRYGSTTAVPLPATRVWQSSSFGLTAAEMSLISGTATLGEVLADVVEIRILSASAGPSWIGDVISATLGVDDISAVAGPPVSVQETVESANWAAIKNLYR